MATNPEASPSEDDMDSAAEMVTCDICHIGKNRGNYSQRQWSNRTVRGMPSGSGPVICKCLQCVMVGQAVMGFIGDDSSSEEDIDIADIHIDNTSVAETDAKNENEDAEIADTEQVNIENLDSVVLQQNENDDDDLNQNEDIDLKNADLNDGDATPISVHSKDIRSRSPSLSVSVPDKKPKKSKHKLRKFGTRIRRANIYRKQNGSHMRNYNNSRIRNMGGIQSQSTDRIGNTFANYLQAMFPWNDNLSDAAGLALRTATSSEDISWFVCDDRTFVPCVVISADPIIGHNLIILTRSGDMTVEVSVARKRICTKATKLEREINGNYDIDSAPPGDHIADALDLKQGESVNSLKEHVRVLEEKVAAIVDATHVNPNAQVLANIINEELASAEMDGTVNKELYRRMCTRYAAEKDSTAIIHHPLTSTVIANNDYTKKLYEAKQIRPFHGKYPRAGKEFYKFLDAIDQYTCEFATLPPELIFEKIVAKLPKAEKLEWHRYQRDKFTEKVVMDGLVVGTAECATARVEFMAKFKTVYALEKFVITQLAIVPHASYFNGLFEHIYARYNEKPTETLKRFIRYIYEMDTVLKKLNPLIDIPIPPLKQTRKLDILHRIFIRQNADEEYNNNGRLNGKVKHKLVAFWNKKAKASEPITLKMLEKKLGAVESELLSPFEIQHDVKDRHWKTYQHGSLFALGSGKRPRNRRWNYGVDKYDNKRPRPNPKDRNKRDRRDSGNPNGTKWCRDGIKCKFMRTTGTCKFRHKLPEWKALMAIFRKQRSNNRDGKRGKGDGKGKGRGKGRGRDNGRSKGIQADRNGTRNSTKNTPCNRGVNCSFYQRGNCKWSHASDKKFIPCSHCNKKGHGEFECHTKSGYGGEFGKRATRYDPFTNINHNKMSKKSLTMIGRMDPLATYFKGRYEESVRKSHHTATLPEPKELPSIRNTNLALQNEAAHKIEALKKEALRLRKYTKQLRKDTTKAPPMPALNGMMITSDLKNVNIVGCKTDRSVSFAADCPRQ